MVGSCKRVRELRGRTETQNEVVRDWDERGQEGNRAIGITNVLGERWVGFGSKGMRE